MPVKTSLAAHEISCQRGGRLLFDDLSFTLQPGRRVARDGPERRRQDEPVAADRGPAAARRRQHRGRRSRRAAARASATMSAMRTPSRAALTVRKNVAFWADFLGGGDAELRRCACDVRSCRSCRSPGWPALGGTEAEAALLRLFAARARSGCSTSRRSRSTPLRSRCWTRPLPAILRKAASPWSRAIRRSR